MMRPILLWLWRLIWKPPPPPEPPPPVSITEDDAFALLRMGVHLTLSEALAVGFETQRALYVAGVRLDADRAAQVAALVRRGDDAWPTLMKEVDEGASLEAQVCAAALAMAGQAMGTRVEA